MFIFACYINRETDQSDEMSFMAWAGPFRSTSILYVQKGHVQLGISFYERMAAIENLVQR